MDNKLHKNWIQKILGIQNQDTFLNTTVGGSMSRSSETELDLAGSSLEPVAASLLPAEELPPADVRSGRLNSNLS